MQLATPKCVETTSESEVRYLDMTCIPKYTLSWLLHVQLESVSTISELGTGDDPVVEDKVCIV